MSIMVNVQHVRHQELGRAECHTLRPVCNELCFDRTLLTIYIVSLLIMIVFIVTRELCILYA